MFIPKTECKQSAVHTYLTDRYLHDLISFMGPVVTVGVNRLEEGRRVRIRNIAARRDTYVLHNHVAGGIIIAIGVELLIYRTPVGHPKA